MLFHVRHCRNRFYLSRVLFMPVAQGNFMFFRKGKELITEYPVLSARKLKGNEAAFFNPPQYGYFTNAAVLGYCPSGEVLGIVILHLVHEIIPP